MIPKYHDLKRAIRPSQIRLFEQYYHLHETRKNITEYHIATDIENVTHIGDRLDGFHYDRYATDVEHTTSDFDIRKNGSDAVVMADVTYKDLLEFIRGLNDSGTPKQRQLDAFNAHYTVRCTRHQKTDMAALDAIDDSINDVDTLDAMASTHIDPGVSQTIKTYTIHSRPDMSTVKDNITHADLIQFICDLHV